MSTEKVKLKVLRAFQDNEVGGQVEIEKHRLRYLEARKMIEVLDASVPSKNRAVGLEKSEKKVGKREK